MKLPSWHVEYTITLLVIFTGILLFIPTSLQSTVQANFITKWKDCYNKLTYMHDVILKHEKEQILTSFKRAKTAEEREALFRQLIKPYFRLNKSKTTKRYSAKYLNGERVKTTDLYYFSDIYLTDKNMVVGIKDVPPEMDEENLFLMMFDINGILPPNTWGKDIFGAKIYPNKVEALGEGNKLQLVKSDCSEEGSGLFCSYYYKIGGSFED